MAKLECPYCGSGDVKCSKLGNCVCNNCNRRWKKSDVEVIWLKLHLWMYRLRLILGM